MAQAEEAAVIDQAEGRGQSTRLALPLPLFVRILSTRDVQEFW
jgi:hypothetical protein